MRIAFFDHPSRRPPLVRHNRFGPIRDALQSAGHDAVLVDAPSHTAVSVVAGASRERDVLPLIDAVALVDTARETGADVAVFPLRGGLAHGVLMACACGEWGRPLHVVLSGDAPTRTRFLGDWGSDGSLEPLVADALERACIDLADAIVVPDEQRREEIVALGARPQRVSVAQIFGSLQADIADAGRIVFADTSGHRAEWLALAEGVERLATQRTLHKREIVFAFVEGARQEAAEVIRLRAQRWSFPYRIVNVRAAVDLAALADSHTRFVFAAHDAEDVPQGLRARANVATVLLRGAPHEAAFAVERALFQTHGALSETCVAPDVETWLSVFADRQANTPSATPSVSVSICILHHERPTMLEAAIQSIGAQKDDPDTEVIVLDNASYSPAAVAALAQLEQRGDARVMRFDTPQTFASVYNAGAQAAKSDVVIFLDDDNLFAPDGLERLRLACATGAFDVVTSNLDLFDDADDTVSPARMAFIGPACTAGLFFNAFGDTCLAFRRSAFLALGGFTEFAGPYPAADWLLMARAQAAGLRIGVLQRPAFRYRRHAASTMLAWQKADRAGARALIRDAYGDSFDAALVAKYAADSWLADE